MKSQRLWVEKEIIYIHMTRRQVRIISLTFLSVRLGKNPLMTTQLYLLHIVFLNSSMRFFFDPYPYNTKLKPRLKTIKKNEIMDFRNDNIQAIQTVSCVVRYEGHSKNLLLPPLSEIFFTTGAVSLFTKPHENYINTNQSCSIHTLNIDLCSNSSCFKSALY